MLFTIGYTAFQTEDFIDTLKQNKIKALVDVRSTPYSEHYPDYNKENLERLLAKSKIQYRNFVAEFGARQIERRYFSPEGYLDFERFVESPNFRNGYKMVIDALAKGHNIVLMCAEKDPATCHRSIMITRAFHERGIEVTHLLANGECEGQADIEQQLLNKYFPDREQLNLFGNHDQEDLVGFAYQKRNAEIGYRIGGNES